MKNAVVIAAGAVAGLVAGGLSPLLFSRADAPTGAHEPPALAPGARSSAEEAGDLTAKLDALHAELEELHMRIAWLEDVAADPRQPVRQEEPWAEAADEDLSSLASALTTPGRPLPDNLKQGVEQVIQDVREAERRERDARRAEVLEERTEKRLNELVDELGLTPVQTNQMREHLSVYSQKRTELFETARESGDFYGVRDSMRELRKESYGTLATILDPIQLERYKELDEDWRGGRGGGGGRRGRDGESRGR